MKKTTKRILILCIVLLIAGMAAFPFVRNYATREEPSKEKSEKGKPSSTPGKNKPLNVNAEVLQFVSLTDIIRTTGSLLPDEEVDLSFETSGKITSILFREGSKVKKGQLLAKVNDNLLQAELKKLEAQLPLAKDRVFRQKSLLAKDAISQEAYEQVVTELDKLNADIDLVKARIAQTELRAPFDGTIGLRMVSEGAYTSPSTVVVKLIKIKPLKIDFSISERHATEIRQGTNIEFELTGSLNKYKATVYAVESTVDPKTRTLKVRATYPNANESVLPGRFASIEIKLHEIKNTLAIPSEAVIPEMGRDIVYLYKNGIAEPAEINKGLRTESRVQVLSGLSAGDTLITTGVMQLRKGAAITIDDIQSK